MFSAFAVPGNNTSPVLAMPSAVAPGIICGSVTVIPCHWPVATSITPVVIVARTFWSTFTLLSTALDGNPSLYEEPHGLFVLRVAKLSELCSYDSRHSCIIGNSYRELARVSWLNC